jgi:hypothetical protein
MLAVDVIVFQIDRGVVTFTIVDGNYRECGRVVAVFKSAGRQEGVSAASPPTYSLLAAF